MNIKQILKQARFLTNTSEEKYPDDYLIHNLNFVYQRIWREIVNRKKDYFWTYWQTDLKKGQTEYSLEVIGANQIGMYTIKDVYINNELLTQLSDLSWKRGERGWKLADNHIILNWKPEKDSKEALKVVGIQTVEDLKINDEEERIFPGHPNLRMLEEALVVGLCYELHDGKQDYDKSNLARAKFEEKLAEGLNSISQRVESIFYSSLEY